MGGVDLLDSLIALYRTKVRSRKWHHKIVLHMMGFTLVNVWLLYRRDCKDCGIPKKEVYTLLKFKAEVAKTWLRRSTEVLPHQCHQHLCIKTTLTIGLCGWRKRAGANTLAVTADNNCFMNFHKQ
ncbi:hypothetical protein JOQ06_011370 [Pogonophryne albipinna]|uniref:PiggyBac transposable element-derived protein domain-containing protein n=1 Tax=Pogonophryne albipinna TaxID=1090488 RepID=A0AAD6BEV5_9TELE|nr:hypothetical protein JOQ06_011370 [Pogonophryne albipinna]